MKMEQRTEAFVKLGKKISSFLKGETKNSALENAMKRAFQQNGWFTEENVRYALSAISEMISEKNIYQFLKKYQNPKSFILNPKSIGVITPSNIPFVGFHDFFCVLMSGNIFAGKYSSQDNILLPAITKMLIEIEPEFKENIFFVENKLEKFDAVIATGSNNTARYFEYYFGKYPHIIRKNRNSVAILTGNETEEELKLLSNDIFLYFGLGCRNVSKIFVPENYSFEKFFEGIFYWQKIIHHNKYVNNYTYHKAIYLMNKIKIWDNGFLLLKEDKGLFSPVAVLFYEFYKNEKELSDKMTVNKENIQCIVCAQEISSPLERVRVRFGQAQHPQLWDYADGIDTMKFLLSV